MKKEGKKFFHLEAMVGRVYAHITRITCTSHSVKAPRVQEDEEEEEEE